MKNKIQLLVYDFDGVFTNNKVFVDENGKESVICNKSDGLAVGLIRKLGYKQIILSSEKNNVVLRRAEKLNLEAYNGVSNKLKFLKKYLAEQNLKFENVAYVGNDINDEEAMKECAHVFCPIDSYKSILKIADEIIPVKGGDGVIRYIAEKLTNT